MLGIKKYEFFLINVILLFCFLIYSQVVLSPVLFPVKMWNICTKKVKFLGYGFSYGAVKYSVKHSVLVSLSEPVV